MKITALLSMIFIGFSTFAQLTATSTSQLNTNCNGNPCDYNGPSILINELMISPSLNDGSISGPGTGSGRGEWIELYNPNLCEFVDISCYFLGNNTNEGNGGFIIPPGTIVPPGGFCLIRGANVTPVPTNLLYANGGNVIEVIVPLNITDAGVCSSGTRVWFPNAGGWFAFYDNLGVAQDAVSWINSAGSAGAPCIPTLTGCNSVPSLNSYDAIPANRKNYITNTAVTMDFSYRRLPDGGTWSGNGLPTYADCNAGCIPAGSSSCTGTGTLNVLGGTPPYTYSWDDSQAQMTVTAIDLCAGTYNVTVTDNVGVVEVFQVTVNDFVPTVSINVQPEICVDAAAIGVVVSPIAVVGQTGTITGNGVTGTNFNPTNAGVGNQTLDYYFEDEFGCNNTASDVILVHPLPVVSITNNVSPYCVSNTPAALVLSPTGGQLTGIGVTNNQFIPAQAGVGTFTLTYTFQDANGCTNSTTLDVTVVGSPPPSLTVPADLCIDAPVATMIGNPVGGMFQIDGVNSTDQFLAADEGAGNHTVSYTTIDGNGCIASTSEVIEVHGLPNLQIPLNAAYCYETGFYVVNPSPAGGVFTGDNVLGNGITTTGVLSGTYDVNYAFTDQFGCSNNVDDSYIVTPPIFPNYNYQGNCFQEITFVSMMQNSSYLVNWNIDGILDVNGSVHQETFALPGQYVLTMTVEDGYGCLYDSTGIIDVEQGISMEEFVVPNVITPNGDGVNDYLEMPSLLDDCFKYEIVILNRWGNLVYRMDSQTSVFSGLNKNGDELSSGVYFYYVESEDFDCNEEKYKGFCYGNITIQR